MTTHVSERATAAMPPSPCVGICTLKGGHCYGCGRTPDEIAAWGTMTAAEQSAVWRELPDRLAAFGFKTFRLAAGAAVVNAFIARTFTETAGRWRIVSANLEAAFSIQPGHIIVDDATDRITATHDAGDRDSGSDLVSIRKHDRVRIFGFASERTGDRRMDTVALVLPKGLARRELAEQPPTVPTLLVPGDDRHHFALALPTIYADAHLAAPAGIEPSHSSTQNGWAFTDSLPQRIAELLTDDRYRLVLRTALGSIRTRRPLFHADTGGAEANAPPDLKISKAFAACAVFHADDPRLVARRPRTLKPLPQWSRPCPTAPTAPPG